MFLLLGDIVSFLKRVARNKDGKYSKDVVDEVRAICRDSRIEWQ